MIKSEENESKKTTNDDVKTNSEKRRGAWPIMLVKYKSKGAVPLAYIHILHNIQKTYRCEVRRHVCQPWQKTEKTQSGTNGSKHIKRGKEN